MPEIHWQNFESNEQLASLHKATPEEVKQRWEEIEHSNHLRNENDVLNKLNLPDEQEETYRETLENLDKKILTELATKSKSEILLFLSTNKIQSGQSLKTKINSTKTETIETNHTTNEKLSKIKQTLTPEILSNHPKIEEKFEALNLAKTPKEKEAILQDVLNLLKEPWVLQSIIKELGWADKNNPKYQEFKNTLIGIDSSFESVFRDIEKVNINEALKANEVVQGLEKDWIVDIDLKSVPAVSKLSLKDSDYSFDEIINSNYLSEIIWKNTDKLKEIENSSAILKGSYEPFNGLLTQIREHWGQKDFKQSLDTTIASFPSEIFSNLNELYKNMEIPSDIQIKESDIRALQDVKSPNELRDRIENIKTKFHKIAEVIREKQVWILAEHKTEIKTLLERKSEAKEKQLETLKFFKASWFDLIPKEVSNRFIRELQSNTLKIPWLDLNVANIDLKNGHFWESEAFVDQDWGINTMAKRNIVKFINKMISWNVGEPLDVETIANGIWVVNPAKLKNDFVEAWIMGWVGWNIGVIRGNLRKE